MFQLTDERTLQFVLQPGERLTADAEAIAWASGAVAVSFRTLMAADASSIADVFNEGIAPGILCLANAEAGKVLVMDLDRPTPPTPAGAGGAGAGGAAAAGAGAAAGIPPPPAVPPPQLPAGLYVFKHAFLCATDGVVVEPKVLPLELTLLTIFLPHLFNKAHFVDTAASVGKLFLQTGSEILCKELKRGETLLVRFGCVVATEATVKVSVVSPHHLGLFCLPGLGGREPFLLLTGPGRVYFSAHTTPRKATYLGRARWGLGAGTHTQVSFFAFVAYFIVVGVCFFSLSLLLNRVAFEFDHADNHFLHRL
jgi:hypothetical protein